MTGTVYSCEDAAQRHTGIAHALRTITAGGAIVMPTDTLYGIAVDAFSPQAVTRLFTAKGRSRSMPPPVLVENVTTFRSLVATVPPAADVLIDALWPGPLTIILHAAPSLHWDLGQTHGTVALRQPDDPVAREVLAATGPLAVSSANRTGRTPAATAQAAQEQLRETVAVYLDDGPRPLPGGPSSPSSIVDATSEPFRLLRAGALPLETLQELLPTLVFADEGSDHG